MGDSRYVLEYSDLGEFTCSGGRINVTSVCMLIIMSLIPKCVESVLSRFLMPLSR